jgi:hypothetical protein
MKNFVVALLCVAAPVCHAARPLVTDDARLVDPDHCQLETFYKEQRAYSGDEFGFLPACNRFDVEWTLGGNRSEGENNVVVQAKKLLKPLVSNGYGLAFSVGATGDRAYLNGIASFSFFEDVSVIHANLGYLYDRPVFGIGLEQLLYAPRVHGILETYGGRGEKPTVHGGLRLWVIPNRFQVDSTYGVQQSDPVRRFFTVGLRFLF